MLETFGDREIALCRELTKIHEQVINTTLKKAVKKYSEEVPKGEFVLIIEGKEKSKEKDFSFEQAVEIAKEYHKNGEPLTLAAKRSAGETGYKKSDIYKELCK